MNILVTGGLGFIGSHTVVELIENSHTVVIVDNLINSKIEVLSHLETLVKQSIPFYQIDLTDEEALTQVFEENKFDGIIHFAGLKSVGESVEKPIEYYLNNLVSTMVVIKLAQEFSVGKFVFSSSATVYGDQDSPLRETLDLKETTSPYGETKTMGERILKDIAKINPKLAISILRYFNPVGAHPSGLIGENPNGIPNNLMPYITKVAKGDLKQLDIFGDDYDTIDGTGVRDYIHVVDLAKGHVAALELVESGVHTYNLGSGKGTSVLEIIIIFQKVNSVKIPYKIVRRRSGDIATCFADVTKVNDELGWKTTLTIEDMCRDMWNFEMKFDNSTRVL
ncbi:UDP-glucose 4-epimerase GalE [Enterococcus eurekensis]|uniref:UDP-glucose 4-epimerase n=1 Tax=Enterococcus eurekensis TaxID=1159753 RepID=A0ABV9M453_9ENTE